MKKASQKQTIKLRALTLLLAIVLAVSALQLNSFAFGIGEIEANDTAAKEGFYEVTELREEHAKHFHLSDGTYRAVTYADSVHRKDADGNWQDIDNRLTLRTQEKGISAYSTDDGRITFAKSSADFSSDGIYTISENGYTVSLSAFASASAEEIQSRDLSIEVASVSSAAEIDNHDKIQTTYTGKNDEEKFEQASKINNRSSVIYENVFASTDLEYVLSSNSVKENIIVKAPRESYSYTFILATGGLTAELSDNQIILADSETGEHAYYIPAPYMYDANGSVSREVFYTLSAIDDERYLLTVTADSAWINSPDTAFPVVIDPTVETGFRATYDMYVSSTSPNTSYGYDTEMWVSSVHISLIQITMPTLPTNRIITNAELCIRYYYNINTGYLTVGAYEFLHPWSMMYMNWNEMNSYPNKGMSTTCSGTVRLQAGAHATATSPGYAYIELTDLVRKWYNGTSPNYGVALRRIASESTNASVIIAAYDNTTGREDPPEDNVAYYIIDYQLLEEGVYGIQNVANSNLWMDIQYDSTSAGAHVQQYAFSSSPVTSFTRSGLFKITFDGGMVNMRTMLNNEMFICNGVAFNYDGYILTRDGSTAADTAFEILPTNEEGVYQIFYGNQVVCANNSTSSGSSGAPDSYMRLEAPETAGDKSKWRFIKYTGPERSDIIMTTDYNELTQFESFNYHAIMYSTNINHNGPVTYSVTNTDGTATDKATINTVTGVFAALKAGSVKIKMTYSGAATVMTYTVNITSSLDHIVEAAGQLDQYAKSYLPAGNRADRAYLVMSYVRIKAGIYTNAWWGAAAGPNLLYSTYIDYVDSINPNLAAVFTNNIRYIYDNNGNKIDFYHLNATLCAMFYSDYDVTAFGEDGKNLFGWAGDLQSLAGRVITYLNQNNIEKSAENIYNYSRELLSAGEGISPFSLSDLYADVDAYNLYQLIENMQMESLDDYIEYYYNYNYNDRFSLFVSEFDYYEIRSIAYDYTFWLTVEMAKEDFHHLQIYQVDAIATAYADHIWSFVTEEVN